MSGKLLSKGSVTYFLNSKKRERKLSELEIALKSAENDVKSTAANKLWSSIVQNPKAEAYTLEQLVCSLQFVNFEGIENQRHLVRLLHTYPQLENYFIKKLFKTSEESNEKSNAEESNKKSTKKTKFAEGYEIEGEKIRNVGEKTLVLCTLFEDYMQSKKHNPLVIKHVTRTKVDGYADGDLKFRAASSFYRVELFVSFASDRDPFAVGQFLINSKHPGKYLKNLCDSNVKTRDPKVKTADDKEVEKIQTQNAEIQRYLKANLPSVLLGFKQELFRTHKPKVARKMLDQFMRTSIKLPGVASGPEETPPAENKSIRQHLQSFVNQSINHSLIENNEILAELFTDSYFGEVINLSKAQVAQIIQDPRAKSDKQYQHQRNPDIDSLHIAIAANDRFFNKVSKGFKKASDSSQDPYYTRIDLAKQLPITVSVSDKTAAILVNSEKLWKQNVPRKKFREIPAAYENRVKEFGKRHPLFYLKLLQVGKISGLQAKTLADLYLELGQKDPDLFNHFKQILESGEDRALLQNLICSRASSEQLTKLAIASPVLRVYIEQFSKELETSVDQKTSEKGQSQSGAGGSSDNSTNQNFLYLEAKDFFSALQIRIANPQQYFSKGHLVTLLLSEQVDNDKLDNKISRIICDEATEDQLCDLAIKYTAISRFIGENPAQLQRIRQWFEKVLFSEEEWLSKEEKGYREALKNYVPTEQKLKLIGTRPEIINNKERLVSLQTEYPLLYRAEYAETFLQLLLHATFKDSTSPLLNDLLHHGLIPNQAQYSLPALVVTLANETMQMLSVKDNLSPTTIKRIIDNYPKLYQTYIKPQQSVVNVALELSVDEFNQAFQGLERMVLDEAQGQKRVELLAKFPHLEAFNNMLSAPHVEDESEVADSDNSSSSSTSTDTSTDSTVLMVKKLGGSQERQQDNSENSEADSSSTVTSISPVPPSPATTPTASNDDTRTEELKTQTLSM